MIGANSQASFVLIVILLHAFFMRFYKIHDLLFWGMDQEYEAFLVKNILTGKHLPLIGVNASDTGLYLGPAFIYFASIPFAIFGGNPLGWAITASLLGVITTYIVFRIGKRIFSQVTGLISALLYAGSLLVSFYDRQFWNPVFVSLLSLFIGYLLYEILVGKTGKLLLLAISFGLALHSHLSLLIFTPLIIAVIWKKRKLISGKVAIYSFFVFVLTLLPVIIFDLRHDFTNTRALIQLILNYGSDVNNGSSLISRIVLFISTLGRYFFPSLSSDWLVESGQCKELIAYRKENLVTGLNLIVGVLSMIWLSRKKLINRNQIHGALKITNIRGEKLLLSIFLITLVFVLIYTREIFEYYFLYFFPWLAILSGYALHRLMLYKNWKIFVKSLLIVFIFINILALLTSSNSFSYKDKINALNYAGKYLKNTNYSLEALGECPRFGGYRYLSEYVIGRPVNSYMDSYFSWLYLESLSPVKSDKILLLSLIDTRMPRDKISHWEEIKLNYLNVNEVIDYKKFGDIAVYLLSTKK